MGERSTSVRRVLTLRTTPLLSLVGLDLDLGGREGDVLGERW